MVKISFKRLWAVGLSVAMIGTLLPINCVGKTYASQVEISVDCEQNAAGGYELQSDIQGSNILHCWNWSYSTIEAHMQLIAECGFTAIQTSPAQQPKDYNCDYKDEKGNDVHQEGDSPEGSAVGTPGEGGTGNWWKLYQPVTFNVCDNGNTWLGTKAELESMCATAEKYGIKVIVDIVANHMGNIKGWKNSLSDVSPQVGTYWNQDMLTNEEYWHINEGVYVHSSDGRRDFTQGCMGMPDLNTANKKVQKYVYDYLDELIDCGVDGFRFDAAKHIETPEDDAAFASDFWPVVLDEARSHYKTKTGGNLYVYGEILNTVGDNFDIANYTKRMSVTHNSPGNQLLDAFRNNNVNSLDMVYPANVSVIWAESHDTYMNEASRDASDKSIVRTWAVVGNKKDAASLFFARPYYSSQLLEGDRDNSRKGNLKKELVQATMGECSTYVWASKEVAAINHFNNRFASASDNVGASGNTVIVQRGDGVILVNFDGPGKADVSVSGLADGSYVDEVSGNTFKVSGGKVTGEITSEYGIAVIYKNVVGNPTTSYPISVDKPMISVSKGSGSIVEEKEITISVKNATSASYTVDNGEAVSFTDTAKVVVGKDLAIGKTTELKVVAKNDDGTTSATYKYTMSENKPEVAISVEDQTTFSDTLDVTVSAENAVKSTYKIGNEKEVEFTGTKNLTIGEDMSDGDSVTIVVSAQSSNGKEATVSATYTKEEQEGGTSVYYKNKEGWSSVYCYLWTDKVGDNAAWPGQEMKCVDEKNKIYALEVKDASYKNVIFNSGNQGKQTADLTLEGLGMLYDDGKWSQYESASPKISVSKSSGEISEAFELTITVTNAEKATYCIDGEKAIDFTDKVNVKVGEGLKPGKSQTIEIVATNGDKTKTRKLTYSMAGTAEIQSTSTPKPSSTVTPTSTPKITVTEAPATKAPVVTATPTHAPTKTPEATPAVKKLVIKSVKASAKTVKVKKTATIKATVSSGNGGYRYQYIVYTKTGKKVKATSFTSKKSWKWKATKAGTYKVKVIVKDAKGLKTSKVLKYIKVKK